MRSLGFSIYPDHGSDEEIKAYIDLASRYHFKRVFMCLLSIDPDKKNLERFKSIVSYANSKGMYVIADVSPGIFQAMDISVQDLSFFKDLGLKGIRLDYGFSPQEEAMMTRNMYGLMIELNTSLGVERLEPILAFDANIDQLRGCHNFFPHRYTGLSREHFEHCSSGYQKRYLSTSAFVSSRHARFGPWPVDEGLCTLEDHRDLPIDIQAKDLFSTNLIDEVIIANAFAAEEDFKVLSKLNPYRLNLKMSLNKGVSKVEKEILFENVHRNRGDISPYMIRSSDTRAFYKNSSIKPHNTVDIRRGDVLIDNDLYGKYAGEVQIALEDMKNYGKTNVVGRIRDEEIYLLDRIKPNQHFELELV